MVCISNLNYFSLKKHIGFTLVELIVVILITGILSVSIAPRFFGVAAYENRKVTDQLLSALRYSQQMAMNRGGNIELVLTTNNFTVQLSGGGNLRSPDGLTPYTKKFPNSINPTPDTVRFNALGQPITFAGVLLTVDTTLTINATNTITIRANTGYATSP